MELEGSSPQPREGAGTCIHPCKNLSLPSKPSTCRSQGQFILHKLIKSNRFVLVSTETLWVFCLCLSHSACSKEQAVDVPAGPASARQLQPPCGRSWPSLHPHAPTQGLS